MENTTTLERLQAEFDQLDNDSREQLLGQLQYKLKGRPVVRRGNRTSPVEPLAPDQEAQLVAYVRAVDRQATSVALLESRDGITPAITRKAASLLDDFIVGGTPAGLTRSQRRAIAYQVGCCMLDQLALSRIRPAVKPMLTNATRLASAVDRDFPGYAQAGRLDWLVVASVAA